MKKQYTARAVLFLFSMSIQWIHADLTLSDIENLFSNRDERVSRKNVKNQQPIISAHDLVETLHNYTLTVGQRLKTKKLWLAERMSPNTTPVLLGKFMGPHVQKLTVPHGAGIACFGDIHGSAHSLVRSLRHLHTLDYLNEDFSIKAEQDKFYLMFLGDYVDRGCYGVEVLYLLMRLVTANPDRVVLIRGNHENVPTNRVWGLGSEIEARYGNTFDITKLDNFFSCLPLACYLGCRKETKSNYILCCHGGPDITFNPTGLLSAPDEIALQKFETLSYKSYASKKISALHLTPEQKKTLGEIKQKARAKGIIWTDEKDITPDHWLMKFGFIWTDFDIYKEQTSFMQFTKRCWLLGKAVTKELLKTDDPNIRIHAILRGHQHHGRLYDELITEKGFVRSWNGMVNTLFSGPASKTFAHGSEEKDFDYDSFAIITTAAKFDDWSFTHWWRPLSIAAWKKS